MNKAQTIFLESKEKGLVKKYEKFGNVVAKKIEAGVKVDTIIDDYVETTNTSKDGDWLVTGVKGEQYLIDDKKFTSRYKFVAKTPKGDKYKAVGTCYATKSTEKTFKFNAPWGEEMICNPGDYIASTSPDSVDDIYRIEKDAFKQTYKEAN